MGAKEIAMAERYHRLTGMWLDHGYQRERGALEVMILGSALYDREVFRLAGPGEALLTVESDGELRGWADGTRFAPDDGELSRIGITPPKGVS
jgi:hypothetical protein